VKKESPSAILDTAGTKTTVVLLALDDVRSDGSFAAKGDQEASGVSAVSTVSDGPDQLDAGAGAVRKAATPHGAASTLAAAFMLLLPRSGD